MAVEREITRTASDVGPRLLPCSKDDVSLWWCDLDRAAEEAERHALLLSPDELGRAAQIGNQLLRRRFIVGRATLRLLLAPRLGTPPAGLTLQQGTHGRPELHANSGFDFSVSHTGSAALIAITTQGAKLRIGVDVERLDRKVDADRLAQRCLTPNEAHSQALLPMTERRQHFLRYWTCKEAMGKATGHALSAPLRHLDIDIDSPCLRKGPVPYVPQHWEIRWVQVPEGYVAALALWRNHGATPLVIENPASPNH